MTLSMTGNIFLSYSLTGKNYNYIFVQQQKLNLIIFQIIQTYHTCGNLIDLLDVIILAFFAHFEPRLENTSNF